MKLDYIDREARIDKDDIGACGAIPASVAKCPACRGRIHFVISRNATAVRKGVSILPIHFYCRMEPLAGTGHWQDWASDHYSFLMDWARAKEKSRTWIGQPEQEEHIQAILKDKIVTPCPPNKIPPATEEETTRVRFDDIENGWLLAITVILTAVIWAVLW